MISGSDRHTTETKLKHLSVKCKVIEPVYLVGKLLKNKFFAMFLRALQKDVYNLKIKKLGVGLIVLFQFAMY